MGVPYMGVGWLAMIMLSQVLGFEKWLPEFRIVIPTKNLLMDMAGFFWDVHLGYLEGGTALYNLIYYIFTGLTKYGFSSHLTGMILQAGDAIIQ